jgi:hypothetical protein
VTGVTWASDGPGSASGNGNQNAATYAKSLAGILGIPQPPAAAITDYAGNRATVNAQYTLVCDAIREKVPGFQIPATPQDWTRDDFNHLISGLEGTPFKLSDSVIGGSFTSAQAPAGNAGGAGLAAATIDNVDIKTRLQNIQFMDVSDAVQTGRASADVAESAARGLNASVPVLSAAEINAQLEEGDLYVNARGQFFLNRQPTNARDAAVAAFVVGGNALNIKLNDMMNKVNLNNTRIQMASYLSAATDVADLQTRIAEQRAQYGFADVLSEITAGALTDGSITDSTDVSGATGTFQSTLKTAINNSTNNQDLDTQSLQSLTTQVQANMTAMTQLIQSFEQMLKSLTQNMV